MKTTNFAHRVALTSVAGAVLVALAAGPAMAGHGYNLKQHPLRGDFPTANGKTESVAPERAAGARTVARGGRVAKAGDWLRGDFPRAGEKKADPPTLAAGGIGDTWTCSLDQASADIGTTPAVMRVIQLLQ